MWYSYLRDKTCHDAITDSNNCGEMRTSAVKSIDEVIYESCYISKEIVSPLKPT